MKARKFGIELEFAGVHYNQRGIRKQALKDICEKVIPIYDKKHSLIGSESPNHWTLKNDGSCGWELTSPVLDLTYKTTETLRNILNGMNSHFGNNVPVDSYCGFHVHFGISDLNNKQFENLALTFKNMERIIFSLFPKSRRSNSYVYHLANSHRNYLTIEDLRNHYLCLNTYRYNKRKTCEIRHAEGTSDPETVISWTTLCAMIIENAKKNIFLEKEELTELINLVKNTTNKPVYKRNNKEIISWITKRNRIYA